MRRRKLNGKTQVGRWYRKGELLLIELYYREGQRPVPQPCYVRRTQIIELQIDRGVTESVARNIWPWAFKR